MMYQSFRAVLLGILVSRTVTGQGCDPSNPFGANCDSSPPAIAIDGQLHLCNMILNQCPGASQPLKVKSIFSFSKYAYPFLLDIWPLWFCPY